MVVHWRRELQKAQDARELHFHRVRLAINAVGAATTALALAVIITAKLASRPSTPTTRFETSVPMPPGREAGRTGRILHESLPAFPPLWGSSGQSVSETDKTMATA
jgi:hypothetical protein